MFKSGFITIAGKPNVGKSTLLNALVGEKVAIVSWRPQTTRNKIVGIMNGENYQAVFIDTPGIHEPKSQLSEYMMKNVNSALDGVDAVIYVLSAENTLDKNDVKFIERYNGANIPLIIVINKMDVADKENAVKMIEQLKDYSNITEIIPISAMKRKNLEPLIASIVNILKEGEAYYPADMITDKNLRFMVGEIIREKAMKFLSEEVPYGIGININKYKEREDGIVDIDAEIICEKKAHKPIIIGHGGSMLKKIGTVAREDIERLIDAKVFLTLWVKVKADWREDSKMMAELGYNDKEI